MPESFSSIEMPLPVNAGNELVLLINQLVVAKAKPKVCPKCKSPYWDTPRRVKAGNELVLLTPRRISG